MADALKRLSVLVRKRLPPPVRRFLQLGKLVAQPGHTSPKLAPELIRDCRFFASRYHLVHALPKGGKVAEVGTDKGTFSRYILKTARPEELHLFDLDFAPLEKDVAEHPCVRLHAGPSPTTLATLPDGSMDWIYVDGDHSYEGVAADARMAAEKLKGGGYLVFNDFAHSDPFFGRYGVHRAVTEFATARQWPIVMLAYDPNALYDVALRKPEVG